MFFCKKYKVHKRIRKNNKNTNHLVPARVLGVRGQTGFRRLAFERYALKSGRSKEKRTRPLPQKTKPDDAIEKTPNMDIWLRVGISHQVSAKFIEALKQACFPGSPALDEEITQKTMHFKRRQIDRKIIPQISTEKTDRMPCLPAPYCSSKQARKTKRGVWATRIFCLAEFSWNRLPAGARRCRAFVSGKSGKRRSPVQFST